MAKEKPRQKTTTRHKTNYLFATERTPHKGRQNSFAVHAVGIPARASTVKHHQGKQLPLLKARYTTLYTKMSQESSLQRIIERQFSHLQSTCTY